MKGRASVRAARRRGASRPRARPRAPCVLLARMCACTHTHTHTVSHTRMAHTPPPPRAAAYLESKKKGTRAHSTQMSRVPPPPRANCPRSSRASPSCAVHLHTHTGLKTGRESHYLCARAPHSRSGHTTVEPTARATSGPIGTAPSSPSSIGSASLLSHGAAGSTRKKKKNRTKDAAAGGDDGMVHKDRGTSAASQVEHDGPLLLATVLLRFDSAPGS